MVYLDFWLCFTQWHIENLVQSFFFFFFFKTWVGPSFIRMHRARVAQAYIWYLPISEEAPYILPIFWENLPTKIWEFPSLFNHSPYLKKKISLFVISNVSHVWTQAFFFVCLFFVFFFVFFRQNFVKAFESCLTNKTSFKFWKETIMKSVKKK